MRLSFASIGAALVAALVMLSISSASYACGTAGDATLTIYLNAIGRAAPSGDATVTYTITPVVDATSGDDDGDATDGSGGDPSSGSGDPEDENDSGEPVTGSFEASFEEPTEEALPTGAAEIIIEASGFEPVLVDRSLCGVQSIHATMFPEGTSTLTMHIGRWEDGGSSKGAKVVVEGLKARIGAHYEGEADASGNVELDHIIPGVYAVSVWLPTGESHEHVELDYVDLLGDAHIATRLRSSRDLPNAYTTSSCEVMGEAGSSSFWASILLCLFVLGQLMRMRRCDG